MISTNELIVEVWSSRTISLSVLISAYLLGKYVEIVDDYIGCCDYSNCTIHLEWTSWTLLVPFKICELHKYFDCYDIQTDTSSKFPPYQLRLFKMPLFFINRLKFNECDNFLIYTILPHYCLCYTGQLTTEHTTIFNCRLTLL